MDKQLRQRLALGVCLALALCALAPGAAYGQVLYGSIAGNVTDSSGGRVPGAEVKVVNPATNFTLATITDDSGAYTLRNVPDGSYTLSVGLTGFKEHVTQNVAVSVGNVTRLDVVLTVGQLTETVSVTGAATLLQTDTTDVRAQLETKEITELPIGNFRNYQTLINLVPGATPAVFQNAVTDTPQRALSTNVNGTARNNNNTRIDGAQSINIWLPHHTGYVPPTETIEVVNISTNNFDAEQGFAGGAATTVISKSGTNKFHGTGFALHENDNLNARDFFLFTKKPESKRNVDGATIGGPIKKDKLFFFAGYEGFFGRQALTSTLNLPTAAMRAGDFSGFSTTIYDPLTGNRDGTGRTAFAGNIIPANRISSAATKIQDRLPLPNLPGLVNNFQLSGPEKFNRHNGDAKIDWYHTDKHRVWGKFSNMSAVVAHDPVLGAAGGGGIGGQDDGEGLTDVKVYGFGHTWTISPKFLVDGNFGLNDMDQKCFTADLGLGNFGQSVLGIPGTNDTASRACPEGRCGGIPLFAITGYANIGQPNGWDPVARDENSYSFTHNFSLSKGRHELRWGYDLVYLSLTHWQPEIGDGPRGALRFGRDITGLNGGAPTTDQNAYAGFLLGLPTTVGKSLQWEVMTTREWQHAMYFRDRWQPTRNLTLTLGLRYELYPLVHRADRPMEQLDFKTLKLKLSNDIEVSKNLIAPRVGFAYRLGDKNVFRAGYGITYDPLPFGRPLRGFYPLTVAATFVGANNYDPWRTLAQGIPLFTGPETTGSGPIDLPNNVQQRSMPPGSLHRGYIQSWNLVYERKLPSSFVISTGYVGTQTVHQLADRELNWAAPGTGTAGRQYFPQFGRDASTLYWDGQLSGNYHSLQVAINRRFVNGLFVKGAYTYSRAISMADDDGWVGVGWNDPAQFYRNRSQTGYNRPHIFQLGSLYELPFAKASDNAFVKQVLGGWQINGIFGVNSNTPFSVTGGTLNANANMQTADQVAEVRNLGGIGVGNPYYDRSSFLPNNAVANPNRRTAATSGGVCNYLSPTGTVTRTGPGNDCYGNSGRLNLRGPTWVNLDLGVFRRFKLTEASNVEFRAEFFNFSNTPKFNNPNGDTTSANYFYITGTSGNANPRFVRLGLRFAF
jgi:hypothetical protein